MGTNIKAEFPEIGKDSEICVIRFRCKNRNMAELKIVIDNILSGYNVETNDFIIRYFKNKGEEIRAEEIFRTNLQSTKHFQSNENIEKSDISKFKESKGKRSFLFEVIYTGEVEDDFQEIQDAISFQYLQLCLAYLLAKEEDFVICISNDFSSTKKIYSAIDSGDIYRIAYFLYYFINSQVGGGNYLRDRIFFIGFSKDKGTYCAQLYSVKKKDSYMFGKILPLFPLSKELFSVFSLKSTNSIKKSFWKTALEKIITYNLKKMATEGELINKLLESDSYLEKVLFLHTIRYIIAEDKEYLTEEHIRQIHEICNDFTQGIMQLIENALFYVTEANIGNANFAIRIRNKTKQGEKISEKYLDKEVLNKLKDDKEEFGTLSNTKYWIELYVTDLVYEPQNFQGIVNKFLFNMKNRDSENINYYNKLIDNLSLKNFFENAGEVNLSEYYKRQENIVHHYGLPILNNLIKACNGFLYVRSGEGEKNTYSNNYYLNKSQLYRFTDFPWHNGTAYIIYLPIKLEKKIDYTDSLISINNDTIYKENKRINKINIEYNWSLSIEGNTLAEMKEKLIKQLKNNIRESVLNYVCKKNINVNMLVIDCQEWFSRIATDIKFTFDPYEILAKAIFLYLVEGDINYIALINVINEYDVIKVFRQFALFYDRQGENEKMKDKSIFIIDKNAEADIILKGNISEIKNNMQLSQIYGGIAENFMKVIKYLGTK